MQIVLLYHHQISAVNVNVKESFLFILFFRMLGRDVRGGTDTWRSKYLSGSVTAHWVDLRWWVVVYTNVEAT